MKKETVKCDKHGSCDATYMCSHLLKGENLGFICGYDETDQDKTYPDAWCNACEKMRVSEDGWTDKAINFAGIKLICSSCYEGIRLRNWIENNTKFEEIIDKSYEYIQEKQKKLIEEYKIDTYERWDWDQDTGLLIFSHDGKPIVEAKIDFSGTFSSLSKTWLWAWSNSSLSELVKSESRKVRDLGDEYCILKLASAKWNADEIDGWEMTTIMARELKAKGVYRTPNKNGFVYMIIKDICWIKNP